jgi:hypothetical protein
MLSLFVLASVSVVTQTPPSLLSDTAVGRFGVGHRITANSASQDLLAWNVVNTGKRAEVRLYDENGSPVSLGECGLSDAAIPPQNEVRDIGWTQLTSRYTASTASVDVLESLLSPVLWFHVGGPNLLLFKPAAGPVAQQPQVETLRFPFGKGASRPVKDYDQSRDGPLTRPYFVVELRSGTNHYPVLCLLDQNPESITPGPSGGLQIRWHDSKNRHYLGLLPLFGCAPTAYRNRNEQSAERVARLADTLAAAFLAVPVGLTEAYRLLPDAVRITNILRFAPFADAWGWSKRRQGYALVPPAVASARQHGYPVTLAQSVTDLHYPLYLGPLLFAPNTTTLTYDLPRPDLYGTIASPFHDPVLDRALPEPIRHTIQDYSAYVMRTYANKSDFMYDGSAIGEGRTLSSEYVGYRMMDDRARLAFTKYADQAAQEKLYQWDKCYGYGTEASNGRRFLLDNYRIGGQDYIDAGWFGYSISAMWARAHYGGRWDEIKHNWPRIRELFYGWNWVYSDYAAMFAPLYVDANQGGNPKGYTDNMGMLPALYAWARMADHLCDRATYQDALYMLARDRIARYNRMTVYEHAHDIGFKTDVTPLVSDMGNGPNIAPSGRYIPPNPGQYQAEDVVRYGDYTAGLWFLSGSFLEPVTAETVDLMATGGMQNRVAATLALFDRRFPRWWACPDAGEMANYQIYLRGALFREDPALLRCYFDYQEGLLDGRWTAEPWHADAFAGIVLSAFGGRDYRDAVSLKCHRPVEQQSGYRPVKDEVEWNLFFGQEGRTYLTLWNTTASGLPLRIHLDRKRLGLGTVARLRDGKQHSVALSPEGDTSLTVLPGANFLVLPGRISIPASTKPLPPLPPVSARFELTMPTVARLPEPGSVAVYARNRTDKPVDLKLLWSLHGAVQVEKSFLVAANSSSSFTLPLRVANLPSGKYELTVRLIGGRQPQEEISHPVLLAPPQTDGKTSWISLYDFEQGTDGWTMPDWPDANKDEKGAIYHPESSQDFASSGTKALRVPLRFIAGKDAKGFVGVRPNADWSPFQQVRVAVYLPAGAPTGLHVGFYMMGGGWKWREAKQTIPLVPGQWTTLEAPLVGKEATDLWNFDATGLSQALQGIIDFGVRIEKTGSDQTSYTGPVYLDTVEVATP